MDVLNPRLGRYLLKSVDEPTQWLKQHFRPSGRGNIHLPAQQVTCLYRQSCEMTLSKYKSHRLQALHHLHDYVLVLWLFYE